MSIPLDEFGGHVFGFLEETGLRQTKTFRGTQGLLEEGRFVFNVASTSGSVLSAGRRLIGPTLISVPNISRY